MSRPIRKVEKKEAGVIMTLFLFANIRDFHVYESVLPPQGLFHPIYTVLLAGLVCSSTVGAMTFTASDCLERCVRKWTAWKFSSLFSGRPSKAS